MSQKTDKFTRLIQLMMMTTSDADGEALVALRKANAMLAEQNMNWEELLRAKVKFTRAGSPEGNSNDFNRQRGERNRSDKTSQSRATDAEIEEMFEVLLRDVDPQSSFREFVEDVHSFWERRGYLTQKQEDAIRRAYNNRR